MRGGTPPSRAKCSCTWTVSAFAARRACFEIWPPLTTTSAVAVAVAVAVAAFVAS